VGWDAEFLLNKIKRIPTIPSGDGIFTLER
jgi:hypothetical protein